MKYPIPINRKQYIDMRVWDLEQRAEWADREAAEAQAKAEKKPGCLMSLICTLLFMAAIFALQAFIITTLARLEHLDHLTFKQVMALPKEPEASK